MSDRLYLASLTAGFLYRRSYQALWVAEEATACEVVCCKASLHD